LRDFYAAPDQKTRREMIEDLSSNITRAESMTVSEELLLMRNFRN
jgi:hypothetical protein